MRSVFRTAKVWGVLFLVGLPTDSLAAPDGLSVRTVQFREVLSIGSRSGDEHTLFGRRILFGVDGAGNIFVNDFDRKQIQEFSPSGTFMRTIGRPGQGPGEFLTLNTPRFDREAVLSVVE